MKLKHLIPLVAVVAVTGAGGAYAAIPSSDETITACKVGDGTLKVIDPDADQTCGRAEPLTWNKQGPMGPKGATGSQGPAGPAGATGPAGAAGKDAKVDFVRLASDGTVLASSRDDIAVAHQKALFPPTGDYKFTIPNGGTCAPWATFESPHHATFNWWDATQTLTVKTYLAFAATTADTAFTLYLIC
jgi:hypothetical protein